MKLTENFNLKESSYMQIGGTGRYLAEISTEKDLLEAVRFSREKNVPIIILGAGSNSIFSDHLHQKLFLKFTNTDIIKNYEDSQGANLIAGAGTNWDNFVAWTVKHKFAGAEALSAIPGTIGACPVQNIGAYGAEVSNIITNVRAFDLSCDEFFDIPNNECLFEYRISLFKKNPGRFIIFSVSFRLSKQPTEIPQYKDIQMHFLMKKQKTATLKEIRKAIIEIRSEKLPDPKLSPNCGSFFENPILSGENAETLIAQFPKIPHFKNANGTVKFYAGWLIENVGLKGFDFGKVKIDDKNALILINHDNASFNELMFAVEKIHYDVKEKFGIELVPEPNLVS